MMNNNGVINNSTNNGQTQQTTVPVVNNVPVANTVNVVDPNAVAAATQSTTVVTPTAVTNVDAIPTIQAVNNTVPTTPAVPVVVATNNVESTNNVVEKPKKKFNLSLLLILIICGLAFYIYYSTNNYKNQIESLRYNSSPVRREEEVELELDSTLVLDLYSKVKTSSKEDLGNPNFDNTLKLYLAFRQIPDYEKYISNCNLFNNSSMENISCGVSKNYVPLAFKEDVLVREYKKLFGEDAYFEHRNIQLSNFCLGGYQYIAERGEYVQGECTQNVGVSYDVEKKLVKATSVNNIVILEEEVNYFENEKVNIPKSLKSGFYTYTFRLDYNYNYVIESRVFRSKY